MAFYIVKNCNLILLSDEKWAKNIFYSFVNKTANFEVFFPKILG